MAGMAVKNVRGSGRENPDPASGGYEQVCFRF
jgi:hypothetical protein